jgi:hypothetical protein
MIRVDVQYITGKSALLSRGFDSALSLWKVASFTVLVGEQQRDIDTFSHRYHLSTQIHDYFSTLPVEVSLIWTASWSVMKVLFLVTRYTPFVDMAVRMSCEKICPLLELRVMIYIYNSRIVRLPQSVSNETCRRDGMVAVGLIVFGGLLAHSELES